jgi:predicted DCC family thiol-disulfide oxidoreductase YuxK
MYPKGDEVSEEVSYTFSVKSDAQVAAALTRPVMIFDGECGFCCFWVYRWRHAAGERVEFLALQNPVVADRFPELARSDLEAALHLVETDGSVVFGAEAVFRVWGYHPHGNWLFDWYTHSPSFERGSEWAYRYIARHRRVFSVLTRLVLGGQMEPPSYFLVRALFLRSLGVIYLLAFASLWFQIIGLVGSHGIMPAHDTMGFLRQEAAGAKIGLDRYHLIPTLCWLNSSDGFLRAQCALGVCISIVLILGIAPAPSLFLLWMIYLSLATVCREFLTFQWDNLLLEAGFLAIFLAPLGLLPRAFRAVAPSRLVVGLLRWLLFRLMFQSGCVKLLSGDPAWRSLTALPYHYETQPLPTWLGWYAHQLPAWAQKFSLAWMFGTELLVPFLVFAPRRPRQVAAVLFITLQLFILLTGNYCFFNLLTMVLCLPLLDDAALMHLARLRCCARFKAPASGLIGGVRRVGTPVVKLVSLTVQRFRLASVRSWPRSIAIGLVCVTLTISLLEFCGMFRLAVPWPAPIISVYQWLSPFRSFNSYGLFAVMTTSRPEIVLEGSNDGKSWLEYEFKYKPGDLRHRPGFVAPHQPRLDWQMWFAALGNYRQNPWFGNFCFRLLEGRSEVLALLQLNPFPDHPPRYLRAVVYDYHFTDFATRHRTGAWWRRERKGEYMPMLTLQGNVDAPKSKSAEGP